MIVVWTTFVHGDRWKWTDLRDICLVSYGKGGRWVCPGLLACVYISHPSRCSTTSVAPCRPKINSTILLMAYSTYFCSRELSPRISHTALPSVPHLPSPPTSTYLLLSVGKNNNNNTSWRSHLWSPTLWKRACHLITYSYNAYKFPYFCSYLLLSHKLHGSRSDVHLVRLYPQNLTMYPS